MRDEFERLVISFYMDNKHPHRQLLGVSKPEFKVMVEEFAKDAGPRFWGKASRLHLSSSAPTWSGSRRSDYPASFIGLTTDVKMIALSNFSVYFSGGLRGRSVTNGYVARTSRAWVLTMLGS